MLWLGCHQAESNRPGESKTADFEASSRYLYSMTLQWEKTIGKIETDLNLDKPVSIRKPEATDPYYWIAYRKAGFELLLTAMEPPEDLPDSCTATDSTHRDLLFGSFYRLRLIEAKDSEKPIDWNREAEFPICYSSMNRFPPIDVPKKFWLYFSALDHRKKIRVSQIEKELHLNAPNDIHHSHGTQWISWFYYEVGDNLTVAIGVVPLPEPKPATFLEDDISPHVFAGDWHTFREKR
jgi:hypothetical protein